MAQYRVDSFGKSREAYRREENDYERHQRALERERNRDRHERKGSPGDKRSSGVIQGLKDNKVKVAAAAGLSLTAAMIAARKKKQQEADTYSDYSDAYDTESEDERRRCERRRRRYSHVPDQSDDSKSTVLQTLDENKGKILSAGLLGTFSAIAYKQHEAKKKKAQALSDDGPPQQRPSKRLTYNRRYSVGGSSSGSESYGGGGSVYQDFTSNTVRRGGADTGSTASYRRPLSYAGSNYSGHPSDVGTYTPSDTSSRYNRRDSLGPIDPYRRRESMRPGENYPPPSDFRQKVAISYR